jgi:hypothetical protein
LKRSCHLILSTNAINTTSIATAQDVPLEDAQESHVEVVMIIIVAASIVVVVVVVGGSMTGHEEGSSPSFLFLLFPTRGTAAKVMSSPPLLPLS